MDVLTISLDALLQRATNPNNQHADTPAIEAFFTLINKEKEGPAIGARLIASRMHSKNEKEAIQTLDILDFCMKKSNVHFHSEVGKFRFLNEMIKLVSPKYLGNETPLSVKQKVLQLLYVWTLDFPKEVKIREAYDMLKKQGVIKCPALSVAAEERKVADSVLQDEEKNKLLQKLLQSKNPEDLQAANRLIKNMVREDDRRAEIKSRKITELEHAHNNVRLLNEMLDSYKHGISSSDELDLINELHQSCERLRPTIFKLVSESQQSEEVLNEILNVNDELGQAFLKYTSVIIKGRLKQKNDSLLDLCSNTIEEKSNMVQKKEPDNMDLLSDVFLSNTATNTDVNILKPTAVAVEIQEKKQQNALNDLDALSEQLLENFGLKKSTGEFNRSDKSSKVPMNLLVKSAQNHKDESASGGLVPKNLSIDLNYLMDKEATVVKNDVSDDVLVDITETEICDRSKCHMEEKKPERRQISEIKLNDVNVNLEDVQPSSIDPLNVLNEKNGVSIDLHFGKNKPRWDVHIIVVTIVSKNKTKLSNFQFQAVLPKYCKLKLQKPSGTELPSYNPFLPPAAITQILLISNPEKVNVSLKFVISYNMDDETVTEMGEVESLPLMI